MAAAAATFVRHTGVGVWVCSDQLWCCCVCTVSLLCLQEVWQLLQEFQALISSYVMKYQPPDAAEWRSVIQEVGGSGWCGWRMWVYGWMNGGMDRWLD